MNFYSFFFVDGRKQSNQTETDAKLFGFVIKFDNRMTEIPLGCLCTAQRKTKYQTKYFIFSSALIFGVFGTEKFYQRDFGIRVCVFNESRINQLASTWKLINWMTNHRFCLQVPGIRSFRSSPNEMKRFYARKIRMFIFANSTPFVHAWCMWWSWGSRYIS